MKKLNVVTLASGMVMGLMAEAAIINAFPWIDEVFEALPVPVAVFIAAIGIGYVVKAVVAVTSEIKKVFDRIEMKIEYRKIRRWYTQY